jgi:DNA-binding XRE family transcriptional regulator
MQKTHEGKIIAALVQHFKMLRLEQGLSHNKLAQKACITRPAISQIESGKRIPTLMVCLKISHALGKKLGDLIATFEDEFYQK